MAWGPALVRSVISLNGHCGAAGKRVLGPTPTASGVSASLAALAMPKPPRAGALSSARLLSASARGPEMICDTVSASSGSTLIRSQSNSPVALPACSISPKMSSVHSAGSPIGSIPPARLISLGAPMPSGQAKSSAALVVRSSPSCHVLLRSPALAPADSCLRKRPHRYSRCTGDAVRMTGATRIRQGRNTVRPE